MRRTHLLVILALVACKKKDEGDQPPATTPAGSGTAVAAAPVPPPADAAPPDAEPPSKHGYCEVTISGAVEATMNTPLAAKDVGSEHWLSAEEAAAGKKRVAVAMKREGLKSSGNERMLQFSCGDGKIASVAVRPTIKTLESKLRDMKKMVGDYPIIAGDDKPNAFNGSIVVYKVQGLGLGDTNGTLHITKFEKGEVEATFEIDIHKLNEPQTKAHLSGKIVYHCADYDRCGRGGP